MLIGMIYGLFALLIVWFEISRRKRILYDQLSLINIFYLANIVVPACIFHCLIDTGLLSSDSVNFPLLNLFYAHVHFLDKLFLLFGSIAAYFGLLCGYSFRKADRSPISLKKPLTLAKAKGKAAFAWIILGLFFAYLMFVFGNSLVPGDPFAGLLLSTYFRAEDPFYAFQRTALNANIYASTTTFLLLSIIGYSFFDEKRRFRFAFLALTIAFILLDSLASGARRNLLIAALLLYIYTATRARRYKPHYILAIAMISVPALYFGKAVLRNLSDLKIVAEIVGYDAPPLEQVFVAACESGISYVESLGTVAIYHGGPRLGMDHVLSFLRMIPFGTFGYEKPWPERIVRISTAYLSGDPNTQDIPPGYLGQCWIDFPFLGFFFVPLLHGMAFALIERLFRPINLQKSPFYLMIYFIAGYLVALPLNSGSLDFICSPEIVLTVILILWLHYINSRGTRIKEVAPTRSNRLNEVNQRGADTSQQNFRPTPVRVELKVGYPIARRP